MAKKKNQSASVIKKAIGEKITNKGNWFMVEIIDRLEPAKVDRKDSKRQCTVWGNWHLIKARNAEKAFEKAEKLGRSFSYNFINSDKQEMCWEYVGIGDLLPIYEDIEDKVELMWTDFGDISFERSKKLVVNKTKHLRQIRPKQR